MENLLEDKGITSQSGKTAPPSNELKTDRKTTGSSIKTINFSGDQILVTDEIPGVYLKGVQYYDLKNIGFINYNGMANLIDFLKSLLEKGVEVKFVNVNDKIKSKIKSLGLEHILTCV